MGLISPFVSAQPLRHKLDFPAGTDHMLIALEASSISRETKGRWLPYGIIHRAERDIVWKMNSAVIKNGKLEVELYFLTRDGRSYAAYCISFGGFDAERDDKLDLVLEKEGDNQVIYLPTGFDDTRRLILAPGTGIDDFRKRFSVSYTMPMFKWESSGVIKW
jgi:hypothetical protein